MSPEDLRKDPAFTAMTLDILQNVLSSADNPGRLVDYLTEEIRELTGARCVIFIQRMGDVHPVLGVNPARHQAWAQAPERKSLYDITHNLSAAAVWDPAMPSHASQLLQQDGFGLSMAIPLLIGAMQVGAVLVLGLPDQQHIESEIKLLTTLAAIVALVLRNSFLFENQEEIIAKRTKELTLAAFTFDNMEDSIYWINPDARLWRVNASACKILGYTNEELLNLSVNDISTAFPMDSWQAHWQELKQAGALHFETVQRKKDGGFIPVDIIANFIELDGKEFNCAIVRDISERKHTEAALQKSEERFELAMRASSDGIFDWNLKTQEIYFSPGWKHMLGYADDELENDFSVWQRLTNPENQARSWEILNEHLQGKRDRYEMEFQMLHKNGHWVDILSRANAIFAEDGTPIRVVGTHVDITARKQAETEREKLQAQLNQAQKMESVGRLAGGVAHDFNNMLGVILGRVELVLEGLEEGSRLRVDLEEIRSAAKRSADLTRQLLTFARKQIIAPKQLDLNDTVERMLSMLRRLIGEDIHLTWKPAVPLWPVKMDPSQIDQILANLCVNARDAIAGVGRLTIETGRQTFDEAYCRDHAGVIPGDFALLAVSDNGCGMDKKTLDNLFEPFFTTKEVGKGTGLGLATVYGIVKQNNGFINVYSEPDLGSTFKIYLPRQAADDETAIGIPERKTSPGGDETILLVEDEPMILDMTTIMLERMGYTVLAAPGPGEAILLAGEHTGHIDLLMTDVVMPEMNGRDLAEKITALYPGIKLLFMSGYTADIIAHQGVLDDGVAFIQKPFSKAHIAVKLRGALDS
ncbi:MAG: PAS domain S-box protein [Desulfobulbaceae bacterium]|nr:PAS domain S-box protein [Desulfobulbaceae bacterium]